LLVNITHKTSVIKKNIASKHNFLGLWALREAYRFVSKNEAKLMIYEIAKYLIGKQVLIIFTWF